MTEAGAIQMLPLPRRPDTLKATIAAHRKDLGYLCKLGGEFLALDTRPMLVVGDYVTRVGESPIPEQLRQMIADEKAQIVKLESELAESVRRYRPY